MKNDRWLAGMLILLIVSAAIGGWVLPIAIVIGYGLMWALIQLVK